MRMPKPIGAPIGGDAAIIGNEVVFRIFRRDAALQRVAGEANVLLLGNASFLEAADPLAFGDPDLRLDDVEAGHDLRHRMLDLDARIDLDEIKFAGVGVDQEFDGSGADIFRSRGRSSAPLRKGRRESRHRDRAPARVRSPFWLRRCIEQSRSKRCTRLPCASPRICTST